MRGRLFWPRNWGPEARASIASWLIRHCRYLFRPQIVIAGVSKTRRSVIQATSHAVSPVSEGVADSPVINGPEARSRNDVSSDQLCGRAGV